MSDHCAIGLQAAIKALKQVVTPAVDAANPLATEQLRMVCGFLALLAEQLPHRTNRIWFELHSATQLAEALAPLSGLVSADAAAALDAALVDARGLTGVSVVNESVLQDAAARLNAAISALVRAASTADDVTRQQIERTVVAHSKAWLDVHRAWFLPLGFDTESDRLPSIATALAIDSRSAAFAP